MQLAHHAAQQAAGAFGGAALGQFRMIEAEALTRQDSVLLEMSPTLQIEFWQGAGQDYAPSVAKIVQELCAELDWEPQMPVQIAFLSPEAAAPWVPFRAGYYTSKVKHHKICLPISCLSTGDLSTSLRHELVHAAIAERGVKVPTWFNEALAMGVSGEIYPCHRWMSEPDLELAFARSRTDEEGNNRVQQAYAQASVIGKRLSRYGDLIRVLTEPNLWNRVLRKGPEEIAVHQVLGLSKSDLFRSPF